MICRKITIAPINAGWDFVVEMANGTEDIWWIIEGKIIRGFGGKPQSNSSAEILNPNI